MIDYYVAALGPTHAHDPYICFRCPMRGDSVCWPLPWAGSWSEADVMDAAAELNNDVDTVAVAEGAVRALAASPLPGKIDGDVGRPASTARMVLSRRCSIKNRTGCLIATRYQPTCMRPGAPRCRHRLLFYEPAIVPSGISLIPWLQRNKAD